MRVPIRSVAEFQSIEADEQERQEESLRLALRNLDLREKPGIFETWGGALYVVSACVFGAVVAYGVALLFIGIGEAIGTLLGIR